MEFRKSVINAWERVKSIALALWARYDVQRTRRLRVMIFAILPGLGLIYSADLYQPVELVIQAARNTVRLHDASGSIVVVGQDDRTLQELGGVNFPRRYLAQGVDRLFKMGAKRIYFDRFFNDVANTEDDAAFIAVMKQHPGKVFLGYAAPQPGDQEMSGVLKPIAPLRAVSSPVGLYTRILGAGLSMEFVHSIIVEGKVIPSMSSSLAGVTGGANQPYRSDYAIRPSSIPTVSFIDVLRGQVAASAFDGKDVVIGPTAAQYHDIHYLIEAGFVRGVYFHVLGAETLKSGVPVDWGRWPFLLVAALLALTNLWAKRRETIKLTIYAAAVLLGFVPVALDARHITADVFPGLFLFTLVAVRASILRNRELAFDTNEASGLPNINALRKINGFRNQTLVALKINNFAEIVSSFDEQIEKAIVEEIKRRLDLVDANEQIYQGDDTLFWFCPFSMDEQLSSHLEGLHAIIETAVQIGQRRIDLNATFGADADYSRLLVARIGSAALCAEEAAHRNEIWKFYDPDRRHEAAWSLSLMSGLERAVWNHELFVEYQPKIDLATSRIIGAEALVRWMHPERGRIAPDDFIPLAERSNRISQLTQFVLDDAIGVAAKIISSGREFGMAVNLSAQLLTQPGLVDKVDAVLRKHGLPAHFLTLEITETAELDRSGLAVATMQALVDHGIHISIDDYGTGLATLDYLRLLPCDEVKLDRSFVASIDISDSDLNLVGDTIVTIHRLGYKVVAEGVETVSVLSALARLGCDVAQGYLLGRPMAFSQLRDLLEQDEQRRKRARS